MGVAFSTDWHVSQQCSVSDVLPTFRLVKLEGNPSFGLFRAKMPRLTRFHVQVPIAGDDTCVGSRVAHACDLTHRCSYDRVSQISHKRNHSCSLSLSCPNANCAINRFFFLQLCLSLHLWSKPQRQQTKIFALWLSKWTHTYVWAGLLFKGRPCFGDKSPFLWNFHALRILICSFQICNFFWCII